MSYPLPLAVALTVLFALCTLGYGALLFVRGAAWQERSVSLAHLLMSVAMLAMPWSWGEWVAPAAAQLVVFGLGAAFFLVLLALPDLRPSLTSGAPGSHHATHTGPLQLGYHAVMMAAMVVMAGGMLGMGGGGGTDDTAMDSMPGMNMGGTSSSGASAGAQASAGSSSTVYVLLAVIFVAGAIWAAFRVLRAVRAHRSRAQVLSDSLLVLMSAGMALAFVPA